MPAQGAQWMRHKFELQQDQEPRLLTVSEIRCRVEEIAEEIAQKLNPQHSDARLACEEAFTLEPMKFIRLMSDFIVMN